MTFLVGMMVRASNLKGSFIAMVHASSNYNGSFGRSPPII